MFVDITKISQVMRRDVIPFSIGLTGGVAAFASVDLMWHLSTYTSAHAIPRLLQVSSVVVVQLYFFFSDALRRRDVANVSPMIINQQARSMSRLQLHVSNH